MISWDPHILPRSLPVQGYHIRQLNPPKLLLLGFIILITAGAMLLKLPFANNGNFSWLEAVFTATSAVTVTGLVVVDTSTEFTIFGQLIVLALIQIGGIGFMTFAVLMASALGFRLGLRQQLVAQESLQQPALNTVRKAAVSIALFSFAIEAIGMLFLAFAFVPEFGWAKGLYHSFFHSISAFNNAGFALFSDSLIQYTGNWNIALTISFLYIVGGIGYFVTSEIIKERSLRKLSIYSRLTLFGTMLLILSTAILFFIFEYDNSATLGAIDSWSDKLLATWFQATTPRTAGFNSVDIGGLSAATCVLFIFLMFVGGAPSSTAGGIKISTLIVLLASTRSFLTGNLNVSLGRNTLQTNIVLRALAVTTIGMMTIFIAILVMAFFEDAAFIDIAFEVVSAFGTVGLSRGITDSLSVPSQILLILIMVIGRAGPLALGYLLATSTKHTYRYAYAEMPVG